MLLFMFELKKFIGGLIMPLPLFGLIAFVMLILAFRGRKPALVLASLSIFILLVLSMPFTAHQLIKDHEPTSLAFNALNSPRIDKIVVLGCDINPNPALSANNQLGNCALTRLVEGVTLAKRYPNATLFVSGGGYNKVTNSALMSQTAINLGVSKSRIMQNPQAMDTAAEAKLLAPKLVDFKVALVTSVLHMPRAKNLFNAQGIEVIPAATDYHNFAALPFYKQFIPNADALRVVTQYMHEVIGSAWISVRRWINPEAL